MTQALRRLSPWSPVESRRLLLLVAGGLVVVAIAWWIVSREAAWDDQTGGMVIAVAGALLAAYGVTSWLLRARTACAARRRVLFAGLGDVGEGRAAPAVASAAVTPAAWVVAHPDQGRYHRPECALAAPDWPAFGRAEVADRRPCGVCEP
jgi:hypothetical protein